MKKYHIRPDGTAGVCEAVISCRYKFSEEEHYSNKEDAQKAYEESMNAGLFVVKHKEVEKISTTDNGYTFDHQVDNYGITFAQPEVEGVNFEEDEYDGSAFYRFDELHDIFDEYSISDVQPGYSLEVPLHSVQKMISPEVVEDYASEKNPFRRSKFKFDNEDGNITDSFPIVGIIKDKIFVIDGNHRFAAAKKRGLKAFAAVVFEFNDDCSEFYDVSPAEFNRRFAKN